MDKLEKLDSVVSCNECIHHSVCCVYRKFDDIISNERRQLIFLSSKVGTLIYNVIAKECSQFKMR